MVVLLPLLFMPAWTWDRSSASPGLGSYTIEAINNQDFAMVFLGSVLYIVGLLLADISYTLFVPRNTLVTERRYRR